MKYIKNTFKSYGFFRTLIYICAFLALFVVGIKLPESMVNINYHLDWLTNEQFNFMVSVISVGALGGLGVIAFVISFIKKNINFFDFITIFGLIASLGASLVMYLLNGFDLMTIIFFVVLALYLITFIVRIAKKPTFIRSNSKAFYSYIYKPSFIFSLLLGGFICLALLPYFNSNPITQDNYKVYYITALSVVGYAILYILFTLLVNRKNFIDDITVILIGVIGTFLVANIDVLTYEIEVLFAAMAIILYLALELRGIIYRKEPNAKYPNYYQRFCKKYDVSFIHILSAATFSTIVVNLLDSSRIIDLIERITNGKFASIVSIIEKCIDFMFKDINGINYFTIIFACIVVILLIVTVVKFKLSDTNIHKSDYALNVLGYISVASLIYSILICYKYEFDLSLLFEDIDFIVYFATSCATIVITFILTCVRINLFNKEIILLDEDYENDYQEETLVENTEEEVIEEVQEEVIEEQVEEVEDDEFLAYASQIAEKPVVQSAEETALEPTEEIEYVEEVEYVEEQAPVLESKPVESLDDEDEEDEEDEIEDDEDEEVTEEVVIEEAKNVEIKEIVAVDNEGNKKKVKRSFITKMMFAPYEAKYFYSEIKNYLMMYKAKGRASSAYETFRLKGIVAKVQILGKTVKVYLPLDTKEFEGSKYRFKDVSEKKRYKDVPFMIKVKSNRSLAHFKELVDLIMERKEAKVKRNFEPVDYVNQLIPNGEAILSSIGYSTDYIYSSVNVRSVPQDLPDDLESYIPIVQGDEIEGEEILVSVFLDTLCSHFNDGEEISLDILKALGLVTSGNILRIRARGTLDRKLTIYADEFDPMALKMMMCANCTAIKIER